MSSAGFWFDSGLNTTQYGGPPDEKNLDLGPTVWAQWPLQGPGPEFKPKTKNRHRTKMVKLTKKCCLGHPLALKIG